MTSRTSCLQQWTRYFSSSFSSSSSSSTSSGPYCSAGHQDSITASRAAEPPSTQLLVYLVFHPSAFFFFFFSYFAAFHPYIVRNLDQRTTASYHLAFLLGFLAVPTCRISPRPARSTNTKHPLVSPQLASSCWLSLTGTDVKVVKGSVPLQHVTFCLLFLNAPFSEYFHQKCLHLEYTWQSKDQIHCFLVPPGPMQESISRGTLVREFDRPIKSKQSDTLQ